MEEAVRSEIERRLAGIEEDHDVRILYACESGSRAWGFESTDSDYDVRFLYVRPRDWYLSIDLERRRDVIELPIEDEHDINGWDLRKALNLFRKSNPPLLEWLGSPIVYRERGPIAARLRDLAAKHYSPIAGRHHYLHMARGNFRDHLRGDIVWRKKYLYVLRPLLAIAWIDRGLGVVPTEFSALVERCVEPGPLRTAIDDLIAEKKAGVELDRGPRIDAISEYIEEEIARLDAETRDTEAGVRTPIEVLNEVFREAATQSR